MKKIPSQLLLAAATLALLAGCSLQRPVAHHAVAYNRAVEKAHNQTVLLNAVRSMQRHPQHYTAITQVLGTASNSLTPSLSLTLVKDAFTPWEPSGSATRSGQAVVTVSVLDDQDFVQGLLSPVTLDQVDFFLSQGWPERLVGMLFVRRIEVRNDDFSDSSTCGPGARETDGKTVIYENEPDESDTKDPFKRVKCFGVRLAHLRDEEHLKIEARVQKSVDFELETEDQDQLAELILKAVEGKVSIERAAASAPAEGDSGAGRVTYRLTRSTASKVLTWGEEGDRKQARHNATTQGAEPEKAANEKTANPDEKTVRIHFRSAQSVVYYLGEIMRAQAVSGYSTKMHQASPGTLEPRIVFADGKEALLFAAWKKGKSDKNPVLAVDYGGETYVIPRFPGCDVGQIDGCHRSMQVLAIVKQLIGLNKSRESLSTTGVVTAIGG